MAAPKGESGRAEGGVRITTELWAAVLLIAAPLWFNATFAVLGKRFDYPDILRRPTEEILERFREGGSSLILYIAWSIWLLGLGIALIV